MFNFVRARDGCVLLSIMNICISILVVVGCDSALKHDDVRIKAKSSFGPIQNYMALKPRNRFYPLPLALHTLVLNRTLVS